MKTITTNKLFALVFLLMGFTAMLFSCQKTAMEDGLVGHAAKGGGGGGGTPTPCGGNYTVTGARIEGLPGGLESCFTTSETVTSFEWTITFPRGTQDVSHFNIQLPGCFQYGNGTILKLYTRDNTTNSYTCISQTASAYMVDPSGCTGTQLVMKYDQGSKSGQITYGIVLAGNVLGEEGTTNWFVKSGSKGGCCNGTTYGPVCPPPVNPCFPNASHGYWFNAPHSVWCGDGVDINGFKYTKAEANQILSAGSSNSAVRAFYQYCAIYLDGACHGYDISSVEGSMQIVRNYLGIVKLTSANIGSFNNAALIPAADALDGLISEFEGPCED